MLQAGLLDEVKDLRQRGYTRDLVSMQGLGYKELLEYLDGDISLEDAIYKIKRDTRHFAKRQLTWFRNKQEVIWVSKDEFDYQREQILEYMLKKLQENNIIS